MKNPDYFTGRLGNRLFQISYLYSQVKEGVIPDWYVQNPRYFEKYLQELRELFGDGIGHLPYTAIHLRVGANPINPDEPKYRDNPFYVDLPATGYYIEALKHFPDGKFLVFSDDMDFARVYFEGDRFAFDASESDLDSFNMMASCANGIICANSSFSYWAALLGPEGKKIIAPSKELWFSDGEERTICPQSWIRI